MAHAPDLPPLRDVIARYGLAARKGLGQHFLLDRNLTDRIARTAGDLTGRTVLEIGPGPGGLTRSLLATEAVGVVAVERDRRCIEALEELGRAYPGRLRVVEADALEVDEGSLISGPAALVSNLPYNISTALLVKWLKTPHRFAAYVLMFQKEVGDRIAAVPGSKAYGRLSVMAQWACDVETLFDVNRSAFTPPPKVTSTVLRLTPRVEPLAPADRDALETVTATVFGQRRKMLRGSLKGLFGDPEALLQQLGIAPTARPEELGIPDLCALARALADR